MEISGRNMINIFFRAVWHIHKIYKTHLIILKVDCITASLNAELPYGQLSILAINCKSVYIIYCNIS